MPRTTFVQKAQHPQLWGFGCVETQARLMARRVTEQRRRHRDQLREQREDQQ